MDTTPVTARPSDEPSVERLMLDDRRQAVGGGRWPGRNGMPRYRALAFSGGGIRSATFSLGVLEAIAKDGLPGASGPACRRPSNAGDLFRASRLSSFDYVSTVSGGGYLGGFLCSLFQPNRLRPHRRDGDPATADPMPRPEPGLRGALRRFAARAAAPAEVQDDGRAPAFHAVEAARAADDAVRVLDSGPPGRIRTSDRCGDAFGRPAPGPFDGDNIVHAPLAWLRENGRYLIPTGTGDAFYAAALGIRNWLALHYVIGTVMVMLLALIGVVRASLLDSWWSLWLLGAAPLALAGVPLGIAFWMIGERGDGKSLPLNLAAVLSTVAALGLIAGGLGGVSNVVQAHPWLQLRASVGIGDSPRWDRLVLFVFGAELLVATIVYALVALFRPAAAVQRVVLTRGLSTVLVASLALAGIALLDSLGQALYAVATTSGAPHGTAAAPAGVAALMVWLTKRLASLGSGSALPAWARKLPVYHLAGFGGIVIFLLVGTMWSALVQWIVWAGQPPGACDGACIGAHRATLLGMLGVAILLATLTGHFAGFINQSSLQPFYSARLTRAYLGASNGRRFKEGSAALSAAEPLDNDNLAMEDYCDLRPGSHPLLKTFAPLHIINVTVNLTVDPAEQLVQRDRKGQPMAVLPFGFSIDHQRIHPFPQSAERFTAAQTGMDRPLKIGEWIGTSGAAFSTGIGRETSLGMSLLMGAANVRLGTWWKSGLCLSQTRGPIDWMLRCIGAVFRTQAYLSYELRARFFGTHRTWQYLSDGGHFENTAIYELLRPNRRVFQVFACDCGADPDYRFEDLANLIRLARIDLDVEITVERTLDPRLAGVFAPPEDFQRMAPCPPGGRVAEQPGPCAILLWARHRGDDGPSTQIVLVKPNVPCDCEPDVREYAVAHPTFPQESTVDQFFNEAQWESYRALGFQLGRRVFNPAITKALDDMAVAKMPGLRLG